MLHSFLAYAFWTLSAFGFVVAGLAFVEAAGLAGPAAYNH